MNCYVIGYGVYKLKDLSKSQIFKKDPTFFNIKVQDLHIILSVLYNILLSTEAWVIAKGENTTRKPVCSPKFFRKHTSKASKPRHSFPSKKVNSPCEKHRPPLWRIKPIIEEVLQQKGIYYQLPRRISIDFCRPILTPAMTSCHRN